MNSATFGRIDVLVKTDLDAWQQVTVSTDDTDRNSEVIVRPLAYLLDGTSALSVTL